MNAENRVPYTGDFAMLNPFPILRDEDGVYHCPLPILARAPFVDGEDVRTTRALCGEALRVVWHMTCPVPDHDANGEADRRITQGTAGDWAYLSWWELQCANGHVVMTSSDDMDADSTAKPFITTEVFGLPHSDGSQS